MTATQLAKSILYMHDPDKSSALMVMADTGTGRIFRLLMRPMSLYESKESSGEVSVKALFDGEHEILRYARHDDGPPSLSKNLTLLVGRYLASEVSSQNQKLLPNYTVSVV